ncbi:alkaline phosphatase family protein [Mycobacteroides chelonae]|uniref:alkaline phosphatase family protein n=1 Tax=Mycobacteroides chelonae TaxID=1774 RepID=UPI001C2B9BE7|nr:alkaline phosphatase family protein [Mycobacteroides chelonae]MBV0918556.1 alkaline phosphatase family protein [Mycobacteroides chelonae]
MVDLGTLLLRTGAGALLITAGCLVGASAAQAAPSGDGAGAHGADSASGAKSSSGATSSGESTAPAGTSTATDSVNTKSSKESQRSVTLHNPHDAADSSSTASPGSSATAQQKSPSAPSRTNTLTSAKPSTAGASSASREPHTDASQTTASETAHEATTATKPVDGSKAPAQTLSGHDTTVGDPKAPEAQVSRTKTSAPEALPSAAGAPNAQTQQAGKRTSARSTEPAVTAPLHTAADSELANKVTSTVSITRSAPIATLTDTVAPQHLATVELPRRQSATAEAALAPIALAPTTSVSTAVAPALPAPVAPLAPPAPAPVPVPVNPPAPTGGTSSVTSTSVNTRKRGESAGDTVTQEPVNKVLVIGVDGTNMSKILDAQTPNFHELMQEGTTGVSSIAGHTTISADSWTTILTGVWDTKHGVTNNGITNDFTRFPSVYTQIERAKPELKTASIADWNVLEKIARGGIGADQVVRTPAIAGDDSESQLDAQTTANVAKSIQNDGPDFLFTHLDQVDHAGHLYGGGSQQYIGALERTDTNVGTIMDAVRAREAATGEKWTVLVVTDHGHRPELGVGHGFQSPNETSTFVIARGPGFTPGQINPSFGIDDITPTALGLLGVPSLPDSDGTDLRSLADHASTPTNRKTAISDMVNANHYPDLLTRLRLGIRSVISLPAGPLLDGIVDGVNGVRQQLDAVGSSGVPVFSQLASATSWALGAFNQGLTVVTNTVVTVVNRLTGAGVVDAAPGDNDRSLPQQVLPAL